MNRINRSLFFALLVLFSCREDENENRNSILGDYEGTVSYYDLAFPGHTSPQAISFTVKKHGLNSILIDIDYEVVVPVTKSIAADQVITLGYKKEVSHTANGFTTLCGGTEINDWGEMCGYYDEAERSITLLFGWKRSTSDEGAGVQLYAERVD